MPVIDSPKSSHYQLYTDIVNKNILGNNLVRKDSLVLNTYVTNERI